MHESTRRTLLTGACASDLYHDSLLGRPDAHLDAPEAQETAEASSPASEEESLTEQEYVVVGPKSIRLFCLQVEVAAWSMRNFGQQPSTNPLLGVVEELGELCHAHLKMLQGIRGTKVEHHKAKIDAVGDVVIYLADYCHREGIDLEDTVARTWEEVRSRNWKADPTHGTDKQLDLQLEHG